MKMRDILNLFEETQNTWYHGTPVKSYAHSIATSGLQFIPQQEKYKNTESFSPLPGVYLTKNLGNAVRYAMMLTNSNEEYNHVIQKEPFGYVFEFSESDFAETTPDEDELGGIIAKLKQQHTQLPKLLAQKIRSAPEVDDSFEGAAILGKWAIKNNILSKPIMNYLVKNRQFINIVNYGKLMPRKLYIFKKPQEQFLKDRNGTWNTFGGYISMFKKNKIKEISL